MSFFEEVYTLCQKIPKGNIATYGQIAFLLGKPKWARQVGWALHACPASCDVPCHRIVNKSGKLCKGEAFGQIEVQKQLLQQEGIHVSKEGTIDIKAYLWDPSQN